MTIGKYVIKKQGTTFNVKDTTKKSQRVNSYDFLVYAIGVLSHDRSNKEKVIAQELLNVLESELRGNTENKGGDFLYMQEYRKIELKFYNERTEEVLNV